MEIYKYSFKYIDLFAFVKKIKKKFKNEFIKGFKNMSILLL